MSDFAIERERCSTSQPDIRAFGHHEGNGDSLTRRQHFVLAASQFTFHLILPLLRNNASYDLLHCAYCVDGRDRASTSDD